MNFIIYFLSSIITVTTCKIIRYFFLSTFQNVFCSQHGSWHELRSKFQKKLLRPNAASAYFNEQSFVTDGLVEKMSRSEDGDIVDDIRNDLDKFATVCDVF